MSKAHSRHIVPKWLTIRRHRVRNFAAPYLLILQHHIIETRSCIVAPVIPMVLSKATLLAPVVMVGTVAHRALLLDMASVAIDLLGRSVEASEVDDLAISAGLDAIFRGYPVGLQIH